MDAVIKEFSVDHEPTRPIVRAVVTMEVEGERMLIPLIETLEALGCIVIIE